MQHRMSLLSLEWKLKPLPNQIASVAVTLLYGCSIASCSSQARNDRDPNKRRAPSDAPESELEKKGSLQPSNPKRPKTASSQSESQANVSPDKAPSIDSISPIKVKLQPFCESGISSASWGWFGTQKQRKTFEHFRKIVRKEYPSHFVDALGNAEQKLVRFVFEPGFRDYRRVQKLFEGASFRIELRPACRSKSERETLLIEVRQFVRKHDYFSQVVSTQIHPGSSRIVVSLKPLKMDFGEKLIQRFGKTAIYVGEVREGRQL